MKTNRKVERNEILSKVQAGYKPKKKQKNKKPSKHLGFQIRFQNYFQKQKNKTTHYTHSIVNQNGFYVNIIIVLL